MLLVMSVEESLNFMSSNIPTLINHCEYGSHFSDFNVIQKPNLVSSTTLVSEYVLKIIIKAKKPCLACFKEVHWMTIITCLLHSSASSYRHEMTCALQEDSMILNNLHRRAEINNMILLTDTKELFVASYLFN